jgi:hypothetical protein
MIKGHEESVNRGHLSSAFSGQPTSALTRLDGERRGEQGSQASDECAAVHSIT